MSSKDINSLSASQIVSMLKSDKIIGFSPSALRSRLKKLNKDAFEKDKKSRSEKTECISAEYFLENSTRYSVESLEAFAKGQSPEIVVKIQESLAPMFKRARTLAESKITISYASVNRIYEQVKVWQDAGVPAEFIEEGVARAICEGFGDVAMQTAGINPTAISAGKGLFGVLGNLFSKVTHGGFQLLKQMVATKILGMLGLDPSHGLAKYIAIALSEVGVFELPKLFTDCRFLVGVLAKALPNYLMQATEIGQTLAGSVVSIIFSNSLKSIKFIQNLTDSLSDAVCGKLASMGKAMADNADAVVSKINAKAQAPQAQAPQALPQAQAPQALPQAQPAPAQ